MMLQALVALAEREGFLDDPAFTMRPVDYLIHLSSDGQFLGFVATHAPVKYGKKTVLQATRFKVPAESTRTVNVLPFFLCDKTEYVLGQRPDKP
ncbi:MAG: type I-C CRISPR-associated protein Cas8c/Csd1, partial [Polyangiales bacterium]